MGLVSFLVIGGGLALVNFLQRVGFDLGNLFWPCGFRARTGLPCLTCGMTRAIQAFCRGDLAAAFQLQPAAGLICLLVIAWGGMGLYVAISGHLPRFVQRFGNEFRWKWFLLMLGILLLAGWAVTFAQAYQMLR